MAQRLVRAKRRLRVAGIGLRESPSPVLPERLDQVMAVLYLIFNEGYAASSGDAPVRHELCGEAIRLAQHPRVAASGRARAARAARRSCSSSTPRAPARIGADGSAVLLDDQDRRLWDARPDRPGRDRAPRAAEAGWVGGRTAPGGDRRASTSGPRTAAETDWHAIAALYADLAAVAPSPVVDLNRAVAVSMSEGPERGPRAASTAWRVEGRSPGTTSCRPPGPTCSAGSAARAEALAEYRRALELAPGGADRRSSPAGAPRCRQSWAQTKLSPMARKIPSLGRFLGVRALYAMAYGEISSSLYYALGITAVYALSLTPVVFAAAGFLFALAAAAYAEGGATIPEPGGASAFARRAFNDLVGFIAGWATVLDFVLAISLSALFLPYYFAGALGQYGWFRGQHGRATACAVAIVLVVTVIRMLRRTDAYTIGVVRRRARPGHAGRDRGLRARAPALGRRAQEQHRPRRDADLELRSPSRSRSR